MHDHPPDWDASADGAPRDRQEASEKLVLRRKEAINDLLVEYGETSTGELQGQTGLNIKSGAQLPPQAHRSRKGYPNGPDK